MNAFYSFTASFSLSQEVWKSELKHVFSTFSVANNFLFLISEAFDRNRFVQFGKCESYAKFRV